MANFLGTSTECSEPTSLTLADMKKALDLLRTEVYYAVDKCGVLEKGEAYKVSPPNQVTFFIFHEDDFEEIKKALYYRVKFIHIREAPVNYDLQPFIKENFQ